MIEYYLGLYKSRYNNTSEFENYLIINQECPFLIEKVIDILNTLWDSTYIPKPTYLGYRKEQSRLG